MALPVPAPVILFEAVCNLCNSWVRFVVRHDPAGIFQVRCAAVSYRSSYDQKAFQQLLAAIECFSDYGRQRLYRIYCCARDLRPARFTLVMGRTHSTDYCASIARCLLPVCGPTSLPMVWEN
jgi:hypothetical protein